MPPSTPSAIKKSLHHTTLTLLERRIAALEHSIAALQAAANEEDKSSAGDKYETAREMMRQEQEKLDAQLAQARLLREQLGRLDPHEAHERVQAGSLVITGEGRYYLAAAVGKVGLDGVNYFVLSTAAPLGRALLGKRVGEEATVRGRKLKIEVVI